MEAEFDEIHEKASDNLDYIIRHLINDRQFYDADFEFEYTLFEESVKQYCDSYCEFYLRENRAEMFFNSLIRIVENVVNCDADMYYEDFFRPAELITYYFGKIISHDNELKYSIHEWLVDFCDEFEGDMLVEEYFKPFINGEKIYHADNNYTGYKDFNKMISVFK